METKTERFILAMTPEDKAVLWYLAEHEQMSAAAIVRRLIWDAYKASGGLFCLGDAAINSHGEEHTRRAPKPRPLGGLRRQS